MTIYTPLVTISCPGLRMDLVAFYAKHVGRAAQQHHRALWDRDYRGLAAALLYPDVDEFAGAEGPGVIVHLDSHRQGARHLVELVMQMDHPSRQPPTPGAHPHGSAHIDAQCVLRRQARVHPHSGLVGDFVEDPARLHEFADDEVIGHDDPVEGRQQGERAVGARRIGRAQQDVHPVARHAVGEHLGHRQGTVDLGVHVPALRNDRLSQLFDAAPLPIRHEQVRLSRGHLHAG